MIGKLLQACGFIRNLYFLARRMNDLLPQSCGFIRNSPNLPGWMKISPAAVCGFIQNLLVLAKWMNNLLPQFFGFIRTLPNKPGWMKIFPVAVCGFIRNQYFLARWVNDEQDECQPEHKNSRATESSTGVDCFEYLSYRKSYRTP